MLNNFFKLFFLSLLAILQYFELLDKLGKMCNESSKRLTFLPEKGQLVAAKYLGRFPLTFKINKFLFYLFIFFKFNFLSIKILLICHSFNFLNFDR